MFRPPLGANILCQAAIETYLWLRRQLHGLERTVEAEIYWILSLVFEK